MVKPMHYPGKRPQTVRGSGTIVYNHVDDDDDDDDDDDHDDDDGDGEACYCFVCHIEDISQLLL